MEMYKFCKKKMNGKILPETRPLKKWAITVGGCICVRLGLKAIQPQELWFIHCCFYDIRWICSTKQPTERTEELYKQPRKTNWQTGYIKTNSGQTCMQMFIIKQGCTINQIKNWKHEW